MLNRETAIERARAEITDYRDGNELEIDQNPTVTLNKEEGGAWVSAWVWVDLSDVGRD